MDLAIDIGPAEARAAWIGADGQPQQVEFGAGQRSMPAVARQTLHGLAVGHAAASTLIGNAETSVVGAVRLLGGNQSFSAALAGRLAFPIREEGGETWCNLLYAEVSASTIYGALAAALCQAARQQSGEAVESVTLTVPAGAEHRLRVAARSAVEAQGYPVRRIINQPAAALLALELPPQISAIINCGAGATEATLADTRAGIRILATASDMLLGSDELAWAVAQGLAARFQAQGSDVAHADNAGLAMAGLRRAATTLLDELALAPETLLTLDHGAGFARDLATLVQRSDVEGWIAPQLTQMRTIFARALRESRHQPAAIASVVLIGEAAHLPWIQSSIAAVFQRSVSALHVVDPAELAVRGAALASGSSSALVWDVTPYPLGISCFYGSEELFSPIIRANTPIPTPVAGESHAATQSYQTRLPDQTSVSLTMLQYRGDRSAEPYGSTKVRPDECELLGGWEFTGLTPRSGQCARFTVTFSIDQDGIVHLTAQEVATGHQLRVQTRSNL